MEDSQENNSADMQKEQSSTPSPKTEKSTRGSAFDGYQEDDSPIVINGETYIKIPMGATWDLPTDEKEPI